MSPGDFPFAADYAQARVPGSRHLREKESESKPESTMQMIRALRMLGFTGAGVSAESGLGTFRGSGGRWEEFKPEEIAPPLHLRHTREHM